MFLSSFDYNIVCVKGSDNDAADRLSRLSFKGKRLEQRPWKEIFKIC